MAESEKKAIRQKLYNTRKWSKLRLWILKKSPICSCGHLATQVHHKQSFMTGLTQEQRERLFWDANNLVPICQECHNAIHNKKNNN
jgi:hypothetical protein